MGIDDFASRAHRHAELGSWLRSWDAPGTTGVALHPRREISPTGAEGFGLVSEGAHEVGRVSSFPGEESKIGEDGVGSSIQHLSAAAEAGQAQQHAAASTAASSGTTPAAGTKQDEYVSRRPRGVRPVAIVGGGTFASDDQTSTTPDATHMPVKSGAHAGATGSSITRH